MDTGHPPDVAEQGYAKFESELGPALTRIIESRSIDNEDDRALLLNLVGLTVVRTPRFRGKFERFYERTVEQMVGMMLATPERWKDALEHAREASILNAEPSNGLSASDDEC